MTYLTYGVYEVYYATTRQRGRFNKKGEGLKKVPYIQFQMRGQNVMLRSQLGGVEDRSQDMFTTYL